MDTLILTITIHQYKTLSWELLGYTSGSSLAPPLEGYRDGLQTAPSQQSVKHSQVPYGSLLIHRKVACRNSRKVAIVEPNAIVVMLFVAETCQHR